MTSHSNYWKGRRVLVTGGTGFIGANLVRRLHSLGASPHLLVRGQSDWLRLEELKPQLSAHVADVRDGNAVLTAFQHAKPDYCFHLASYGSSSWHDDDETIIAVTRGGIANLIDACCATDCKKLVNAGTSSEYGFKDHPPTEDEALTPNSTYASAKADATRLCQRAALEHGLHAPTARIYSAFGPWESTRRFIPALLWAALGNSWPPLVNPAVARDFVYVDDVVDLLLLLAQRDDLPADGVYNVGTGTQTTIGEAVSITRDILEVDAEPTWGSMPDRAWDTTCWVANADKAKTTFDWQPRDFATGLKQTIDWLSQRPSWR